MLTRATKMFVLLGYNYAKLAIIEIRLIALRLRIDLFLLRNP